MPSVNRVLYKQSKSFVKTQSSILQTHRIYTPNMIINSYSLCLSRYHNHV